MSLLRRIEQGRGGSRLLRLLLEKLNQDGRLESEVEALLQDEANDIHLSEDEQAHLKTDPVDFLQAAAQRQSAPKVNTEAQAYREIREEMIRRVEADDEIQSLRAGNLPAMRERIQTLFDEILAEHGSNFSRAQRTRLFEAVTQAAGEFGPLEPLLNDPQIIEIRVLGPQQIWVNRIGRLEKLDFGFENHQHLLRVLDRIVTLFGKTLDAAHPSVQFKMPDGNRVSATIPPFSPGGAVLMIRKYSYGSYLSLQDLLHFGTINQEAIQFLSACVKARLNILITGEASTGTTTLMVALGKLLPGDDFIIVVDDDVDVGGLPQEGVVHFQTRPLELGEINKTQLIQQALAMNVEHVLLGDLDGTALNEMIRAWPQWLATMRAYSVEDALGKLESGMRLVRGDDAFIPMRIAGAVDLVVYMERLSKGARRVGRISEVQYSDGALVAHDIYALEILNPKLETRLRFVDRPLGEQFNVPEINTLFG